MTELVRLAGKLGSCWTATALRTDYPKLGGPVHADAVIVGGGIVGLTAALRLSEAGRSVVLLEGLRIGRQVTGRSTAKITTQHSLIYRHLTDSLGFQKARAYAEANSAGARQLKDWIEHYRIDCDLENAPAYTYTLNEGRRGEIDAEAEAARAVGLRAEVIDRAPLPFETAGALCFPDQAQFNPARYLVGLASAVTARGGRVFEASRAVDFSDEPPWQVSTDLGNAIAEHVAVATNMTVKSPVGMANLTQPRSHTAMAFRLAEDVVLNGMFIGIDDPTRSIRTGHDAAGRLLIVLGPKFNTGQEGDVRSRFVELESWARTKLPVGETAWHWCNEDYDTADRVPFIGLPDADKAPGFHIATGFNAWGITNGTAGGMLIADLILGRPSPWQALYDPTRSAPKDFHEDGDSQSVIAGPDEIGRGEGGVLIRNDEKIAVHRDAEGRLHAVSASCTHKGCTVTWNNADGTWDCPCHGSLFAADGSVIHGPARKPLTPVEL